MKSHDARVVMKASLIENEQDFEAWRSTWSNGDWRGLVLNKGRVLFVITQKGLEARLSTSQDRPYEHILTLKFEPSDEYRSIIAKCEEVLEIFTDYKERIKQAITARNF